MKNILLLISIAVFISACGTKEYASNTEANKKIVLEMFEAFNNHDWEKMASYYGDSAIFKDPSFGNEAIVQTKADIVKKYAELEQMFPDVKDSLLNIYAAENDHIVVEFISHGKLTDTSEWKLPIATIFKLKDNKIVEDFTYYNNEQ